MYLFTIVPFLYFLKTRLKGKIQRISWIFVYFIPSFILFDFFVPLVELKNIALLIISITLINYIYENGYLQNDIKTTKKEKNPTLRLSFEEMQSVDKNWNKIVFFRVVISLVLIALFYFISNDISLTLGLFIISLSLQILYLIYNNIRNIWNLLLILPINYIRFYGFIIPFVSTDKLVEVVMATILLYPLSKVIEFTKRERFNLIFIGNAIGNIDKFRIYYYSFVFVLLFFFISDSIYFEVALYYLVFRTLSYLAISKLNGLKNNSRSSSFIKDEEKHNSSSQYSGFERKIAFILTKFPGLKLSIKKLYQRLNYIRYKKNYNFKSDYKVTKIALENKESYFGYYDKSPINKTNEYIIFQSTNISTTNMPDPKVPVDMVVYDLVKDEYETIGQSYTYNWQQGTKLMWIDEYRFIYNDFDESRKQYISKIYDIKLKDEKIIDYPIYDCFEDKFAISLNFERLDIARADYSYNNLGIKIDWEDNNNDGLYYVDIKSNSSKLIISLEDVIKLNYKETMKGAKHKFNHVMISPDGTKIMFMHRWFLSDGRRYDTLYVSNVDGSDIKIVSDDDMVSHCFWYDNTHIFAYLRDKTMGDKYYMLDINSNKKEPIGEGLIDKFGDGHPHVKGTNIIFDTYPDKARMKSLYKYNYTNKKLEKLGEFLESFDFYGETRCDLHPRFSFDGEKVFFDSVHEGQRGLYMMEFVTRE